MRPLNEVDMEAWVQQAPDKPQRGFREAVHIILESIGRSQHLHARMVMKGGLLMAIRYDSSRYTRDIDFSMRISDFLDIKFDIVDTVFGTAVSELL